MARSIESEIKKQRQHMKKHLVVIALAVSLVPTATLAAPEDQAALDNVRITSPSANATVDTVFALAGSVSNQCAMESEVSLSDKNEDFYRIAALPNQNYRNGTFTYNLDLKNAYRWTGGGQLVQQVPVAGPIKLYVYTKYPDCMHDWNDQSEPWSITLNFKPSSTEKNQNAPKPAATVPPEISAKASPTPSPSVSPLASVTSNPNAEVQAESKTLSPGWWVLIGGFAGAILLGLAEWTAIRYRRKHSKLPKKK